MAKITLSRIDDRLIHGQIIVKWSKSVPVDRILIVDDQFAGDPFMVTLYKATAPKHLKFSMFSLKEVEEKWKNGFFRDDNILLLTKTVDTMKGLVDAGIPIEEVNVGGIAAKPSSVVVSGSISVTKDDIEGLKSISQKGKRVFFKMTPDETGMELSTVVEKYFK